ncbi:MAG: hypothetical protein Q9181_003571 [Wetmoreana brouardii]
MAEPGSFPFDHRQHRLNGDTAKSLRKQDKHAHAADLLRENLAMSSKHFNANNLTVLNDRDSLSDCLHKLGGYGEAIKLDEVTLWIRQKIDGEGKDTIATLQSLADNLRKIGRHDKAIPLYQSALDTRIKTLGWKHNDTLDTIHNLATSLCDCRDFKEACRLNAQLLKTREERLAADDYSLIATRHNLATNHYYLGDLPQAAELTNQNLQALENTRASTDSQVQQLRELQERIESTSQRENVKRARAIRARNEAGGAPSQAPKASRPDLDARMKHDSPKFGTPRSGSEVRTRPDQHATGPLKAASKHTSLEQDTATRKKTGRIGGDSLKPEVDIRARKSGKDTKTYQISNTTPMAPTSSPSSRGKAEMIPGPGQALQQGSIPFRGKTRARPRSSDEQMASSSKSRTLSTPVIDKSRSRSVGAISEEQKSVDRGSHRSSELRDTREGKLFNSPGTQSKPQWFVRFEETQSLVAQSRKARSHRVRIAILDTGIDLSHPYFDSAPKSLGAANHGQHGPRRDRVKECRSFVHGAPGDCDSHGHGTHCAALLLDLSPNADIYVARVTEQGRDNINPEAVNRAISHAADAWKVAIITMSFGWPQHQAAVQDAIDKASMCGVLFCAAASNYGANDDVTFPANTTPVFCVHSVNEWGKPSDFTPNRLDRKPNFAVLGENVHSAWPGCADGKSQSGTSAATPILAAVMALILEFVNQKPSKTSDDMRLQDYRVMEKVLLAMSDEVENYRYVKPWKKMSNEVDRGTVENRILEAIGS